MQVVCKTSAWWWNKTFHPKGSVVLDVPEGTPVPQGFLVDGVEVPMKPKIRPSQLVELLDARKENRKLQTVIEQLQNQIAELAASIETIKHAPGRGATSASPGQGAKKKE